jgi:flavin reductase (DIM6/NTAB) family NADH-FMN oxidoreductase RutF
MPEYHSKLKPPDFSDSTLIVTDDSVYTIGSTFKESAAPDLPFNPFKALVAPRPIGWISTLAPDGSVNLAPYSYFQAVADNPDIVIFSATPGLTTKDGAIGFTDERKHSESNAISSGEFVCNLVTEELAAVMNMTSAHLPQGMDEAAHAGIEMLPSTRVKPPRVAASPAAIECVVVDTYTIRHRGGEHKYQMVFGEVVGIHIDDRFISEGRVDTTAMRILTRMGYDEYAVLTESFSMTRPDNDPILDGMLKV